MVTPALLGEAYSPAVTIDTLPDSSMLASGYGALNLASSSRGPKGQKAKWRQLGTMEGLGLCSQAEWLCELGQDISPELQYL